jgi:hypothetical protein
VSISRPNPRTECRPLSRERVVRILQRLNLLHQSDACSATRPWKPLSSNCRHSLNSRGLESLIFSPPLFGRSQHFETGILRVLVSLLQICAVRKNSKWTSHRAGQAFRISCSIGFIFYPPARYTAWFRPLHILRFHIGRCRPWCCLCDGFRYDRIRIRTLYSPRVIK